MTDNHRCWTSNPTGNKIMKKADSRFGRFFKLVFSNEDFFMMVKVLLVLHDVDILLIFWRIYWMKMYVVSMIWWCLKDECTTWIRRVIVVVQMWGGCHFVLTMDVDGPIVFASLKARFSLLHGLNLSRNDWLTSVVCESSSKREWRTGVWVSLCSHRVYADRRREKRSQSCKLYGLPLSLLSVLPVKYDGFRVVLVPYTWKES